MLQTIHVFLDTEVFVRANFQFASGHLRSIADLVQDKRVLLYLTTVTVREVEANIINSIKEAKKAINLVRKEGRILRNLVQPSFQTIFNKFDQEAIQTVLIDQFHEFLKVANVEIISLENISLDSILEDYFSNTPPFSGGSKKHEFPDAFALASIKNWCVRNDRRIYVISSDKDMIYACGENTMLLSLDKIEALLELIVLEDEYLKRTKETFYEENKAEIEQVISEQFPGMGFWLEGFDGDVEDIIVDAVDLYDIYLIDVGEEELVFEMFLTIDFSAEVSYVDPDSIVYDKEENKTILYQLQNITVDVSSLIQADAHAFYDRKSSESPTLSSVNLDVSQDISVNIDNYHYFY